jgi:hypothetical protein
MLMCSILTLFSAAAPPATGWAILHHFTLDRSYSFVIRGQGCFKGRITSVAPDAVDVERAGQKFTLNRTDVLRIGESAGADNLVYSGRSSWSDLASIRLRRGERLQIRLKDGRQYTPASVAISDSQISFHGRTLEKIRVAAVIYQRVKPLSSTDQRAGEEMPAADPALWPNLLDLAARIQVLVYDASQPEDNSPVTCK